MLPEAQLGVHTVYISDWNGREKAKGNKTRSLADLSLVSLLETATVSNCASSSWSRTYPYSSRKEISETRRLTHIAAGLFLTAVMRLLLSSIRDQKSECGRPRLCKYGGIGENTLKDSQQR